jgi:hypothetical protein
MKTPLRSIAGALALLLAAILLPRLPATATPIHAHPEAPPPPSLVDHLRTELQSKEAERRQNALADVTMLTACPASCTVALHSLPGQSLRIENETTLGSVIDMSALLPNLQHIYRRDRSDELRLQALTALFQIGNEKSIETLVTVPAQSSDRVAKQTQRGLVAFYLDRYPELTEKALRRGTFSLDDVRTARLRQERMQKKLERQQAVATARTGDARP